LTTNQQENKMSYEQEADYVYESALYTAKRQGLSEAEARRYAQDRVLAYWKGEE
jgi:flagellar biosynthesis/type III secretory pathway protein FliH